MEEYPFIVGQKVRGEKNQRSDQPCQDAVSYQKVADNKGIVAVADGLGSREYSHIGATVATNAAVNHGVQSLNRYNLRLNDLLKIASDSVQAARNEILKYNMYYKYKLKSLGGTLLVSVVMHNHCVTAHIGDGGIICKFNEDISNYNESIKLKDNRGYTKDAFIDGYFVVSPPEKTVYANETSDLSLTDWEQRIRYTRVSNITQLSIFTDGISGALIEPSRTYPKPMQEHLTAFFSKMNSIEKKVDLPVEKNAIARKWLNEELTTDTVKKYSKDDRTLALIMLNNK